MKLDNHKAIQELQINRIFRFLALIIVPFLLVNLSRYYYLGWTYLLYYDILAAVIILTISINSTKLAYYFKASFLMFLFLGIAIFTGLSIGAASFMPAFLLLTVFVSVTFLNKNTAIATSFLCGLIFLCGAILSIFGILPLTPDLDQHSYSILSLFSYFSTLLFMAIIVIFIGGDIGNLLTKKYISLEEKNAEFITSENVTIGLQGILTICTQCEKIRDKSGNWIPIESYIQSRSEIKFSHSLCENCAENLYGNEDWYLSLKDR